MSYDLELLETKVQTLLAHAERGHDYWHAKRVVQNARAIYNVEGGNATIIEASAWVHDIIDEKFASHEYSWEQVQMLLSNCGFALYEVELIQYIISNISFKGGFTKVENPSLELLIVQDADRLDALGAIGIARAFHYGGFKNRDMYNPDIAPQTYTNPLEYRNSQGHTINHFYEKLFTLRDTMNTPTAKQIAYKRHVFMENFVEQFFEEWNGNL